MRRGQETRDGSIHCCPYISCPLFSVCMPATTPCQCSIEPRLRWKTSRSFLFYFFPAPAVPLASGGGGGDGPPYGWPLPFDDIGFARAQHTELIQCTDRLAVRMWYNDCCCQCPRLTNLKDVSVCCWTRTKCGYDYEYNKAV